MQSPARPEGRLRNSFCFSASNTCTCLCNRAGRGLRALLQRLDLARLMTSFVLLHLGFTSTSVYHQRCCTFIYYNDKQVLNKHPSVKTGSWRGHLSANNAGWGTMSWQGGDLQATVVWGCHHSPRPTPSPLAQAQEKLGTVRWICCSGAKQDLASALRPPILPPHCSRPCLGGSGSSPGLLSTREPSITWS